MFVLLLSPIKKPNREYLWQVISASDVVILQAKNPAVSMAATPVFEWIDFQFKSEI